MPNLIPAILANDEEAFRERLKLVEKDFPLIQIDVMDGKFVANKTWFDAEALQELETPAEFELHLMVLNPPYYIEETQGIKKIVRYLWHVEAKTNHIALIGNCHDLHKQAGLAISPKTPVEELAPYADLIDEILVMGAEPGTSGQKLQPQNIERVREIHKRWPNLPIGFDIDVNAQTIPELKAAGVSRFCAASAIFEADNPSAAAKKLLALLT
jgi:ribulose-phosphate 3-epimerase